MKKLDSQKVIVGLLLVNLVVLMIILNEVNPFREYSPSLQEGIGDLQSQVESRPTKEEIREIVESELNNIELDVDSIEGMVTDIWLEF